MEFPYSCQKLSLVNAALKALRVSWPFFSFVQMNYSKSMLHAQKCKVKSSILVILYLYKELVHFCIIQLYFAGNSLSFCAFNHHNSGIQRIDVGEELLQIPCKFLHQATQHQFAVLVIPYYPRNQITMVLGALWSPVLAGPSKINSNQRDHLIILRLRGGCESKMYTQLSKIGKNDNRHPKTLIFFTMQANNSVKQESC